MIDQDTLAKLKMMRLSGMADFFEDLANPGWPTHLTAVEVIKMAVDREWERRRNTKLARLRRAATLAQPYADISDIRMLAGRQINLEQIAALGTGQYLLKHQDVIIQGPTGAGKTYLACALGNKAIVEYKSVLYLRADELFDRLTVADKMGTKDKLLKQLISLDLLIIDDWFLTRPGREQVKNLHGLIDRRYQNGSTIYCTQLPPSQWHDRMDEKILADAIIDRITASAHTITLDCADSLRRHFATSE
jgi:DNA replication protein DnaC